MGRECAVCGKKPSSGNAVSFSHRRTRRRWLPNLQRVRIVVGGQTCRANVCTSCLKANKVAKAAS